MSIIFGAFLQLCEKISDVRFLYPEFFLNIILELRIVAIFVIADSEIIPHRPLTLSLLMLHKCGVSKMFGEWHQKTNKTEDTNKLTLLAVARSWIAAVRRQSKNVRQLLCDRFLKRPLLTVSRSFMNVANLCCEG
jgi:hypothetical protein